MNDQALQALAAQHSLPPSLLYGLQVMAPDRSDEAMGSLARLVVGAFSRTRTWEGAVSAALTGDPKTVENPTNPQAGTVNAVLGIAASRPDWGMQGYRPANIDGFAGAAKAMQRTASSLARLGGVVTPEHVTRWSQAITAVKYPAPAAPTARAESALVAGPTPPPPDLAHARAVGQFGARLKQMGMTPDHFKQLFPHVASTYRRLLGKSPELDDVASHVGQTPDQVLESVRHLPAPGHPDHTAGQMMDAWKAASLHSVAYSGRTPFPSELTGFISAGMKHDDIRNYYREAAQNRGGRFSVQRPRVIEGGEG